ncbi:hypothetical protein F4825DRAFT_424522 [Nemania diffusa]|nr:hypothetical protein F4825DRAFT_424522 [Nemania diffusa]
MHIPAGACIVLILELVRVLVCLIRLPLVVVNLRAETRSFSPFVSPRFYRATIQGIYAQASSRGEAQRMSERLRRPALITGKTIL